MGDSLRADKTREVLAFVHHHTGKRSLETLEILLRSFLTPVPAYENNLYLCLLHLRAHLDNLRHFFAARRTPARRLQVDVEFCLGVRFAAETIHLRESLHHGIELALHFFS